MSPATPPSQAAIRSIWHNLQGPWHFKRTLHSINASEPSGKCTGTAAFTPRPPAVFIDEEGKPQTAVAEMLYAEQGELKVSGATIPFSRKYVWRLHEKAEISVWFTRPGTETVDYLFHNVLVQNAEYDGDASVITVECTGGHLCVEDYYSSTYAFYLQSRTREHGDDHSFALDRWRMSHEVRGPKKDQLIETAFSRVDA